jgi:hypothetical protein
MVIVEQKSLPFLIRLTDLTLGEYRLFDPNPNAELEFIERGFDGRDLFG